MKKILATGLLAICAVALSQQQASAWVNARFGIGLCIGWQSGGNGIAWGAWKNGQVPGPAAYGGSHYYPSYNSYFPSYTQNSAPTYLGDFDMPAQQSAQAQPAFTPLYHGATYQRPAR